MFDEIVDVLSTSFTLAIIIGIVCIIIAVIKGISDSAEHTEKMQQNENTNEEIIKAVISQSRQLPTDVLVVQRNEIYRVYDVLVACKRAGSLKNREFAWIKVSDVFGCSMNMSTCHAILQHLNSEIERRGGPKFVDDMASTASLHVQSCDHTPDEYTSMEETSTEEGRNVDPTFSEKYEEERIDIIRRQLVFVDCSGSYRRWGEPFVDFKGNWCQWGDGFYDYDGNYIRWGGTYKDSSGAYRNWGDDFIDFNGNWVRVK